MIDKDTPMMPEGVPITDDTNLHCTVHIELSDARRITVTGPADWQDVCGFCSAALKVGEPFVVACATRTGVVLQICEDCWQKGQT